MNDHQAALKRLPIGEKVFSILGPIDVVSDDHILQEVIRLGLNLSDFTTRAALVARIQTQPGCRAFELTESQIAQIWAIVQGVPIG